MIGAIVLQGSNDEECQSEMWLVEKRWKIPFGAYDPRVIGWRIYCANDVPLLQKEECLLRRTLNASVRFIPRWKGMNHTLNLRPKTRQTARFWLQNEWNSGRGGSMEKNRYWGARKNPLDMIMVGLDSARTHLYNNLKPGLIRCKLVEELRKHCWQEWTTGREERNEWIDWCWVNRRCWTQKMKLDSGAVQHESPSGCMSTESKVNVSGLCSCSHAAHARITWLCSTQGLSDTSPINCLCLEYEYTFIRIHTYTTLQ